MDALRQPHGTPLTSRSPSTLTNDDIEAVIQMATSSRPTPDGRSVPLKDTRTQLFVGNLPYRVRWQDLKDLFRRAGTVLRADVSLGPDNRSRGYGTVLLATAEDAGRAIDMFNGYSWQTRVLEVRPDRLPAEFDATVPPALASASGASGPSPVHAPTISEQLDYSAVLDLHHNFPGASNHLCRNLFVGNLPFHCQWQDLKDLFRQAGTIMRADVALGPDGRSRGFGTVSFATESDAERAVKMFNGYEYNGRALKVNFDKFNHVGQPNAIVSSAPISSTSPASASPAPSFNSAPEPRISMPSALHARKLSSHILPGKLNLPLSYHLDLRGSGSTSPSQHDIWGSPQSIAAQKARDDRDRELLRTFRHLDIEIRASSTLSNAQSHAPTASRSTSTSSTKPPSLAATSSSGSGVSSTSSLAASGSVPFTADKSNPPQPSLHHRRLSSSSQQLYAASPSLSSAVQSSTAAPQNRRPTSHRSPPSHHHHPHRPGPISLPPPPHVTSFPLSHNLSPHGLMGLSPHHLSLGSPTSPFLHPHAHAQQQHQGVAMTPHGLPPITPSMPPFNFLPPSASSPTVNTAQHAYTPYAHPLPSPLMMHMPLMMQGAPSSPMHHPHMHQQQQHVNLNPNLNAGVGQQQEHRAPFGINPISPPATTTAFPSSITGTSTSTATVPNNIPPSRANQNNNGANNPAAYTPIGTFSPGVAMSPGAFWGRPGGGTANPMINPAVGAPVHVAGGHGGHMSPGVPVGVGVGMNMSPGYYAREPAGYFDAGYFPPMYGGQGGGGGGGGNGGGVGGSGLVNEILKDKGEVGGRVESGGGAGTGTGGRRWETVREGGWDVRQNVGAEKGRMGEKRGKGQGLEFDEEAVSGGEESNVPVRRASGSSEERTRRHSSTTTTPWQLTLGAGDGDLRMWEGREEEEVVAVLVAMESEGNERGRGTGTSEGEIDGNTAAVISRTHSMSSSKKPADMGMLRQDGEADL
ncbi:hypothetical protein Hypma_002218 [Hypsizygus marmoreus]|uniref:RRM domain-containing protein n=1 Tax=Hypsizygus marmoreus TaxID=39966 RepID=A0A369JZW4_HYPMA|nr:hypothetical protein Hypma_002218 [Hypsizygus marmoreus]